MGVANVLETDEIGAIDVVVTLNGEVRSDIQCTSVEWGLGTAGSTATFVAGGRRWEELRGIVGAEVGVSVDGLMVFLGVVTGRTGAATGSDNTLALRATSFVGMMDTVYIGQGRADEEIEFYYPRFAIRDGAVRETGWNIKTILRDIFSSSTPTWRGCGARLPAGWRSKVELGTMSALDKSYNQFPLEDITFRLTTLTAGIEQLLGLVGTVSFEVFLHLMTAIELVCSSQIAALHLMEYGLCIHEVAFGEIVIPKSILRTKCMKICLCLRLVSHSTHILLSQ